MSKFFRTMSVVEFAVVNADGKVIRTFRSTKSELHQHFPYRKGFLVVGPNVFAVQTVRNIAATYGVSLNKAQTYRRENMRKGTDVLIPATAF